MLGCRSGCPLRMKQIKRSKFQVIRVSNLSASARKSSIGVRHVHTTIWYFADKYIGSRRLITYRRIPDADVVAGATRAERIKENGVNANDLNPFRKGYFLGFKTAFRDEQKS